MSDTITYSIPTPMSKVTGPSGNIELTCRPGVTREYAEAYVAQQLKAIWCIDVTFDEP